MRVLFLRKQSKNIQEGYGYYPKFLKIGIQLKSIAFKDSYQFLERDCGGHSRDRVLVSTLVSSKAAATASFIPSVLLFPLEGRIPGRLLLSGSLQLCSIHRGL